MSDKKETISKNLFLGVDVGSGSVRAVVVDEKGSLLGSAVENLETNHPRQDYHEQSSEQIWKAICDAVNRVVSKIDFTKGYEVKGVGFDATCSLVIIDSAGHPLSVSPIDPKPPTSPSRIWDVIMWMDHRAIDQAERINQTKHDRLKYAGRQISPEMEPPKLLWLKEKKPETWAKIGHAMDLADFLTYKASGSLIRSQCTTVSKWLYEADAKGGRWNSDFWSAIALPDLINSTKIGSDIKPPGAFCGILTPEVVTQFGLPPSSTIVAVAVGIIDAHAGVLGVLGANTPEHPDLAKADIEEKMAIISGTSACHMASSKEAHFVDGVWGPNFGVILDGYWLNEAGQNAMGPILDEVAARINKQKSTSAENHQRVIDKLLEFEKKKGPMATAVLTKDLHVWPDYRGNRSPLADPNCKGVIAGLRLKSDIDESEINSTAVTYLAHIQAFAYMTRFIMETITEFSSSKRKPFSAIYLCGGLQKNPIYVQTHADVCRLPVIVPADSEVVARGAAILGANASGVFGSLQEAMRALSCSAVVVMPKKETFQYHEKKYKAFRLLGKAEAEIRRLMIKDD